MGDKERLAFLAVGFAVVFAMPYIEEWVARRRKRG